MIAAPLLFSHFAAAKGAPPVTLRATKKPNDLNHLAIKNVAKKEITEICYSAVYKESNENRLYFDCAELKLAPSATFDLAVCESCSNELPALTQLTLENVRFSDDTRWYHSAPPRKTKSGAPISFTITKLTYRLRGSDCDNKCETETVYEIQNTTDKPIAGYGYDYTKRDGKSDHSSTWLNRTLDPGELSTTTCAGSNPVLTEVSFFDKTEWKAP